MNPPRLQKTTSRSDTAHIVKEQSMSEKKLHPTPRQQSFTAGPFGTNGVNIEYDPHDKIIQRYQDQQHKSRDRRRKPNPRASPADNDQLSQLYTQNYFTQREPQEWDFSRFAQHYQQIPGGYKDHNKIRSLWLNMLLARDQDLHDPDTSTREQIRKDLINTTWTPEPSESNQTFEKQAMGNSVEQDNPPPRDSNIITGSGRSPKRPRQSSSKSTPIKVASKGTSSPSAGLTINIFGSISRSNISSDHGVAIENLGEVELGPPLKKPRKDIGHDAYRDQEAKVPIDNIYSSTIGNIYSNMSRVLGSVRDFIMHD